MVRRLTYFAVIFMGLPLGLSAFFAVPYILSAVGMAALIFFGHLVTIDDDWRGGWSNPDGDPKIRAASVRELGIKGVILVTLLGLAAFFPEVRSWGA